MSNDKILRKDGIILNSHGKQEAKLEMAHDGKVCHETFHHEEIMDQMIKTIEFTKMDKKMRSILLLRLIYGYSIQRMQIHLFFHGHMIGNSRDELIALETEGKRLIMETLKNNSMQDIINSINAKPSVIAGLRNELATPKDDLGLS